MKKLILLTLLFVAPNAFADGWVLVSEGETGSKVFVEQSSIEKSDDHTTALIKQSFVTEQTASDNKTKYNEMQVKYIFNCKDQKVAVIEGKKLNSAGDVVQSDKYEDVTWVKTEPDTVIHHAMGYTCDYVN